jgi:hypothetical protein
MSEFQALVKLIKAYSKRVLRYDDDALNAISGILNSLTKPGSGYSHFWGILYDRPDQQNRFLRIEWKSSEPGHRRESFPSWSPLGWSVPMNFTGIGMKPADEGIVRVWTGQAWVSWYGLNSVQIESLRTEPPKESRILQVVALTVCLSLTWVELPATSDRAAEKCLYCAGIYNFLFKPSWDSATVELNQGDRVWCAAFMEDPSLLLILKPSDISPSHIPGRTARNLPIYERIGTIDLQSKDYINLADDEQERHRELRLDRERQLRGIPKFEMQKRAFFLA